MTRVELQRHSKKKKKKKKKKLLKTVGYETVLYDIISTLN